MSQRILITGAYGYVGGRVAQTLSAGGAAVSLGTRQEQVSPPAWLPSAQVVHLDWRSNAALQSVCAGTDAIVHLAAMNEVDAARDLQGALEVNGMWSLRLLEAAQAVQNHPDPRQF